MSGGIEEPYSIASLPKPLDAENGKILGANVYSINGSRKRKRHEVAIGVDGESLNIHNTQNQTTATSYALPPHSYLAAPPCSIYCKRTKPLQPQRQTYIAVRDGSNGSKARLVSITEDLGKPQSEEREPRAPTRRERKLRQGNVKAVDIVSSGHSDENKLGDRSVLVSYANGNVDCMTGDLSATRWEHTRGGDLDFEVEFAAVVDFDTARKGLLRNREDVVALLDANTQGTTESNNLPLLVQVTRSDSRRSIAIYAIRNSHGQSLQIHRSSLDEVLSYELPFRQRYGAEEARYQLHAASGMLYQQLGSRLNIVDLSGTTPKLSFELGRKGSPIVTSFTRLSAATVLVVSPGKIGVYDVKYGSLLSSLDYPSTQQAQNAEGTAQPLLAIITQFADLSIVVGLSGTNLVALQVGDMLDDGKRAKAHGPLLLEVMGKGKVAQEPIGTSQKQEKKRRRWEEWTSKVDRFTSESDIEALENLVAKDFHVKVGADSQAAPNGETNGHANGVAHSDDDDEWELPAHTYDPQYVNRAKAIYILGKTFRWQQDRGNSRGEYGLEIAISSRNILRWLATAGYLTESEIQLALSSSEAGSPHQIVPGDVMAAIGVAEPSLGLMCDLVGLPVYWPLDDVVQGLQLLIRTLNSQEDPINGEEPPKALTNGDVDMEDGDVDSEMAAAYKQLNEAQTILESGLAVRGEVCRLLLARLQSFPHKEIVRTMKRMMIDDDIILFIQILRLEVANGGWTQRYVEHSNDDEENFADLGNAQEIAPSDQAIRTIANLFSCAVDAIGLSGWLVGRSAHAMSTFDLIESLRNEISFALEGLFQAKALDTMLKDLTRTAGGLQHRKRKRQEGEEEPLNPEQALMPLGGRTEPPVVGQFNSKTGIKSKAAIAEQKNRQVGKYSFERIRI